MSDNLDLDLLEKPNELNCTYFNAINTQFILDSDCNPRK